MSPTALCAILLVAAVDYGYEPMDDGGIRYLIRIEPHMVDLLARGQVFGSDIPPEAAGRVRAFRVYSAEEPASKVIPPAPPVAPSLEHPHVDQPPALGPAAAERSAVSPPAAKRPVTLPDMFLAPEARLPSDVAPRQLPKTENVEHALALSPEKPPWQDSSLGRGDSSASRSDLTPKPYLPLMLAVLVAAGSSTGMLYFGWLAFDYRARYRSLLRQMLGDDQPLPRLAGHLEEELSAGRSERNAADSNRRDQSPNATGRTGMGNHKSTRQERVEGPRDSVRDWLESGGGNDDGDST